MAAHLYPVDAGAYTQALAVAVVRPDQEIPRVPFASVVEASGAVRPGESVELVFEDGTRLVPDGPLKRPSARLFAERGPEVILHPAVTGDVTSWRHAQSLASTEPAGWEAHLVGERRAAVSYLLVGVALLVIFGALLAVGLGGLQLALTAGTALVAGVASFVNAGRGLRALAAGRRALQTSPTRMRMRLWWTVSPESHPVAMASLAPAAAADPAAEALHLQVVNVPNGFEPPPWQEVEVFGDIDGGSTPIIKSGDVELWPAGGLRRLRRK